jgi:arsenite methyltransferase
LEKKTCCAPSAVKEEQGKADTLKGAIRERYGQLAKSSGGSCCGATPIAKSGSSCCESSSINSQAAYTEEELRSLPEKAMAASAGCGNPTALAELKPGETVLDLGSGGGIDIFLSAHKVGPEGKAIGVDMTPEMIDLARENASRSGLTNVEFRLGEIEHLPVADESVDIIISNCVINLSTDKDSVFKEAYRVLKRGGRILVSDVMAEGLPDKVRKSFVAWSQCVGGAIPLGEYTKKIRDVGFSNVEVLNNSEYSSEFVNDSIAASANAQKLLADNPELRRGVEQIKLSHAEIRAQKI